VEIQFLSTEVAPEVWTKTWQEF